MRNRIKKMVNSVEFVKGLFITLIAVPAIIFLAAIILMLCK
ncbi:hypothetical protein [Bacillus cereus]|nr:hypothetical protein [Bacillus cereus]